MTTSAEIRAFLDRPEIRAEAANEKSSRAATRSLTTAQKKAIREAFFEVGGAKPAAYRLLSSPAALEYLVSIYNWDDGPEPILWVLKSPLCDRGTALKVYWLSRPEWYYGEWGSLAKVPRNERLLGAYACALAAERRLTRGKFKQACFGYDPAQESSAVQARVRRKMPAALFKRLSPPGDAPPSRARAR